MGLEEEAVQKKHNRAMIYTIFWSLVFVVVVIYLNASQLKPVQMCIRDSECPVCEERSYLRLST